MKYFYVFPFLNHFSLKSKLSGSFSVPVCKWTSVVIMSNKMITICIDNFRLYLGIYGFSSIIVPYLKCCYSFFSPTKIMYQTFVCRLFSHSCKYLTRINCTAIFFTVLQNFLMLNIFTIANVSYLVKFGLLFKYLIWESQENWRADIWQLKLN